MKTIAALTLFLSTLLPAQTPGHEPNLLVPAAVVVGGLGIGFFGWTQVSPRISMFEEVGLPRYLRNVSQPPRWDHDHWVLDYIAHPVVGSETFLLCRNEGFSFFASLAFSAGSSALWEYGFEAFAERPSFQDLIITPLIGSLIGEIRFQLGRTVKGQGGWNPVLQKIVLFVLDPIDFLMAPWREARARAAKPGLVWNGTKGGLSFSVDGSLAGSLRSEWSF